MKDKPKNTKPEPLTRMLTEKELQELKDDMKRSADYAEKYFKIGKYKEDSS